MPEEVEIGEVGVDRVNEEAHEKAHHAGGRAPWLRWLALSTAVFAVVAALASLRSGHFADESLLHATEATLRQAQASDQWAYYQAKGLKRAVRDSEANILSAMHAPADDAKKALADASRYQSDQKEIEAEARKLEGEQQQLSLESATELKWHQQFSYIVTMLQVAIGLAAVAALIERRSIWLFALLVGVAGVALFAYVSFGHVA